MLPKSLNLIKFFGFTLLRNGVKYDYSFRESFTSLSKITESVYVAVDLGEDSTFTEVQKLPKIKNISSVRDMNLKKGLVLSVETNKALKALRDDHGNDNDAWGIYLQADEVLHEDDYKILKSDIEAAHNDGCDAIAFRYLHFRKTNHTIAIGKKWYPHEVRAIKLNTKIGALEERILRMNDIWELPEVAEVVIVGNLEKYSARLLKSIAAKKVSWVEQFSKIPKTNTAPVIITSPGLLDLLLKRAKANLQMKSKLTRPYNDDLMLIMQVSSQRIGIRHG